MKLPKLEFPKYTTDLPWSGRTISYRPYSVKEEKILMMAAASEDIDPVEAENSIIQIIENCCSVDVTTLHPSEVEWLFMKLRIASVSPVVELDVEMPDCDEETCPGVAPGFMNLNDARFEGIDDLKSSGFKQKNDSWIIMLSDTVGVQMKDIKEQKGNTDYHPVLSNIKSIFDEENVYPVEEISREELENFLVDLPPIVADKIKSFFEYQPRVVCTMRAMCPVCSKKVEKDIVGLSDFFV